MDRKIEEFKAFEKYLKLITKTAVSDTVANHDGFFDSLHEEFIVKQKKLNCLLNYLDKTFVVTEEKN